jgi:hypothetical protein
MQITADFPGGNILVDGIDGDTARIRQDRRTTTEWWFYWNFRVSGVAGREVRFVFGDGDVIGSGGPCLSEDGGATWRWLGRECVEEVPGGTAFTHRFGSEMAAARLAFCIPHTEQHLHAYLAARPRIERTALTTSEAGREVELLTRPSSRGDFLAVFTARLHACETMGSYVLEGLLDGWDEDSPDGAFLRERVDARAVPFFDKDGVEAGDQGKLRAPHDHNRDFTEFRYAATRAFAAALPGWRGAPTLALDLHCPWIRGGRNEEVFLVGVPEPWEKERARFSALWTESQQGDLTYRPENDVAFGREWNTSDRATSSGYLRANTPVRFAAAVEMPYAVAGGRTVTVENARMVGRDLARAVSRYIAASARC